MLYQDSAAQVFRGYLRFLAPVAIAFFFFDIAYLQAVGEWQILESDFRVESFVE